MGFGRYCMLVMAALSFFAAACSSSPRAAEQTSSPKPTHPADDDRPNTEPSNAEPTETFDNADSEPVVNEVFVSPIGEALGVAQDELAGAFANYVRDAEELIRECMAEAGFEYMPTLSGIDQASRRQFELEGSLTREQFTDQYGFGIATLFELNFKGDGVVDFVNQQFGPAPSTQRSGAEQAAYEIVLNGQTTQGLSPEEAQEQLFGSGVGIALDGSCRDYGYSTAENPGSIYDGLFSLLGDEVDALTERFENDVRIRDATADWQVCMATEGHSYENRFEITDEINAQAQGLANQYLSSTQVLTALGQAQQDGFASMDNEARHAFLEEVGALQGFAWVPEVQAEFDELIDFELLVAADSQSCADQDLYDRVQFELETEFVEQHADQLALIAAGDV